MDQSEKGKVNSTRQTASDRGGDPEQTYTERIGVQLEQGFRHKSFSTECATVNVHTAHEFATVGSREKDCTQKCCATVFKLKAFRRVEVSRSAGRRRPNPKDAVNHMTTTTIKLNNC